MKPAQTAIGIGGNLGDREATLRQAVARLQAEPALTITRRSSWYETQPVGFLDQPPFLNAALAVESFLPPGDLLAALLQVESRLGRTRTLRNGPRVIDLDLLLYDDRIIERPGLSIPHPRMTERAFVLVPLAEILPDAVHPVFRRSIAALLDDLGRTDHLVAHFHAFATESSSCLTPPQA